jgi:hypothetical protein
MVNRMMDPGIGTFIRYWLHYSNLTSSFLKQLGSVRQVRDDYEKQIIDVLQKNSMEKATIQTHQGTIRVIEKREPHPLTLSKIQELLHQYYAKKGSPDETLEILKFIRSNRGVTTHKSLKQTHKKQDSDKS